MASDFVHDANIKRFERLLLTETDPARRASMLGILGEERAKDHATRSTPGEETVKPPAD